MTSPTPLQRYAAVQTVVDRELAAALRDAAEEGQRIVDRLSSQKSFAAKVQRAQIATMTRELRKLQGDLWGHVTLATQAGMAKVAMQAAEGENLLNRVFFNQIGGPIGELERALHIRAQAAVQAYQAKMDNGISLSQQVYRTQALATGQVDRIVGRSLLLGQGWKQIADGVKDLIRPDVPGGVSYAANRLARTEINNAFHRAQIDQRKDSPFTEGFKWNLSGSHPKPDACNDYADDVHFKGGDPGVFRSSEAPGKPHPNCLCYLTTVMKPDNVLFDEFVAGKYNTYIDEQVYKYAPHVAPC